VSAVWAREDEYWRDVKAGDAEHYETLWHEQFVGWPCDEEHPLRKTAIGDWVRKVRDKHLASRWSSRTKARRNSATSSWCTTRSRASTPYPDGHAEGQGKRRKITPHLDEGREGVADHRGMCGELPSKPDSK
jgi:hypothetical protein